MGIVLPHLSPTTLTADEQRLILRAAAGGLSGGVRQPTDR
jgi:hypothetical protein